MLDLNTIRAAALRAEPYVFRTPVIDIGDRTFAKLENLQLTGSFKVRGFAAAALSIPTAELDRGLITMSAGNAAQAAAYVAHRLGVGCKTVMPDTAPDTKVNGVKKWGGVPVLKPRPEFLDWIATRGWESEPETFIHPFADERVIAGHGGLGLELLEQIPDLERVLGPVGGGGLITGVASAIKALRPSVEVIGVQSDGYALWPAAFAASGEVRLTPTTIADGTTAPFDASMYDRLSRAVDRWVVVSEADLRQSIPELMSTARIVAEGAGALAFAALRQVPPGPVTAIVVSGGNIAQSLLVQLLQEAPSR